MPELPEVETICRGISPHIINQTIQHVIVRQAKLRWQIPDNLPEQLTGLTIRSVKRRAKYLLLTTDKGTLLIHLGMSGRLRVLPNDIVAGKHDHVDILFSNQTLLRFNDTRRFGAILWTTDKLTEHPLLKSLGVEPLSETFNAQLLSDLAKNRKVPLKTWLMDSHVVVGVGNIYANEALFMAGLAPTRLANSLNFADCERLVHSIRSVLQQAIAQGGTTLKDFVNEAGQAGYFQQTLRVYGRAGLPCLNCGATLQHCRLNNRTTVFCSHCQT